MKGLLAIEAGLSIYYVLVAAGLLAADTMTGIRGADKPALGAD